MIPGGCYVHTGILHFLAYRERLAEQRGRLELLILMIGNPRGGPIRGIELSGLERSRLRGSARTPFTIPYRNIPVITGMRFQGHSFRIGPQVVRTRTDPYLIAGSLKALLISGVFPCKSRRRSIQADRLRKVFRTEIRRYR